MFSKVIKTAGEERVSVVHYGEMVFAYSIAIHFMSVVT